MSGNKSCQGRQGKRQKRTIIKRHKPICVPYSREEQPNLKYNRRRDERIKNEEKTKDDTSL